MDKLDTYASWASKDAFFKAIAASCSLDGIGLYHSLWKFLIKNNFSSIPSSTDKLRLVLGVGRSGTTWISNTLAKTRTPVVFLEEPIYHVYPPVCLAKKIDHTASPFISKGGHAADRLLTTYRILSDLNSRMYRILLSKRAFPINRDDTDAEILLIKEVHALLATEYLISHLDCKVILISRHYITVVDSILNFSGVRDPLLWNEFHHINDNEFLTRYFDKNITEIKKIHKEISSISDFRLKAISAKALVVFLIQKMFSIIAITCKNVIHVSYEEIMKNRDAMYMKMSEHFQIEYTNGNYSFDDKKPIQGSEKNNIARADSEVFNRKNKFLSQHEIAYLETLFAGLSH